MEFEWDLSKELVNARKHGVTFSEAVESFFDPHGFQLAACGCEAFPGRGTFLLGRKIGDRAGADDPVYPPGTENPDHRVGGVAEVQETLR